MTSRDFCFWLQGYFELARQPGDASPLHHTQIDVIKAHLALVFKHEIDPSMGDAKHQADLNATHHGPLPAVGPGNIVLRC